MENVLGINCNVYKFVVATNQKNIQVLNHVQCPKNTNFCLKLYNDMPGDRFYTFKSL